KLFDRIGRQIVPTKAGILLYKHAKEILDRKQHLIDDLQNFLGVTQGELLFGASTTPGTYILPSLMGRFKKQFPQATIQILLEDSQRIIDKIIQGEIELGMVGALPENTSVTTKEFMEDELLLVVPSDHPWRQKKTISLFELMKEPLFIREVGSGTRQIVEDIFKAKGYKIPIDFNTSVLGSSEAIKQAVLSGLGVSVLSRFSIKLELQHGLLFPVRLDGIVFKRKFYYIYHAPRSLSPLAKSMLSFLEQQKPDV
ncbi:MAG: LysR substrate-binding domain-containing protein, partial [Planctomycetota bacterium]